MKGIYRCVILLSLKASFNVINVIIYVIVPTNHSDDLGYNFVLECVGALLETLMFSRNPTTKGHLGSGWAGQSSQSHPCRSNQMGHLPSVQSFDI